MSAPWQHAVVAEALRWRNTPYHHAANVRGAGVDCAMLLVEVFKAVRLIPADLDPRPYPHDFHLHRSDERYLGWLTRYADALPAGQLPQPGDVATFQFGRCVSHAGIVLAWPLLIHAYLDQRRVMVTDIDKSQALAARLRAFYRVKVAA